MNFNTICVHGKENTLDPLGAVSTPIYQSATFARDQVGAGSGYDYSRLQNPTREKVETLVCNLEGGVDAVAFSSGMAATAVLMELFKSGDHIIASDDLYGGTVRLFDTISTKNGISVEYVNTSCLEALTAEIKPNTKAIFIETPTNPMMQITDIKSVSEIAKAHDLLLIVDNTFLTPYFQKPISLGADVVLHSGTKFLSGHNDTLSGFLVVNSEALSERVRFRAKTIGACLAPFDSWLMIRGIKTLSIRMEKQQENAKALVAWLGTQSQVDKVYYAGIGAMISIELNCERLAIQVLERTKLILFAESLGGTETLVTYPYRQTHADVPEAVRRAKGINEKLVRISVGLEHIDDIIADLEQAMR